MKNICASTLLFALAAMPLSALADNCKVKIKEKNGHYKQDIKCKGHPHAHAPARVVVRQSAVVVRQPAVVVRPARVVVRTPAVVIQPPAPPAVVIRPPGVTVRVN